MKQGSRFQIMKWISMIVAIVIVIGGVYVVWTAPTDEIDEDQQQLQAELAKNETLLKQQEQELSAMNMDYSAMLPATVPAIEPSVEPSIEVPVTEPPTEPPTTPPTVPPTEPPTEPPMEEPSEEIPIVDEEIPAEEYIPEQPVEEVPPEPVNPEPPIAQPPAGGIITAVGDSVMLGAVPEMQKRIPGCIVDAKVSRQVWDAMSVVQKLDSQGQLGASVIIGLGTNCPFKESVGQELLNYLGSGRTIYWVNAYGQYLRWQEDVNTTIRVLAEKNSNVVIMDWASVAAGHPEWFYKDGIHLKAAGQVGYAEFIAQQLGY